ncbi:MAG: hypothetical protein QXN31_06080 [Desulfurococcus sp.]
MRFKSRSKPRIIHLPAYQLDPSTPTTTSLSPATVQSLRSKDLP